MNVRPYWQLCKPRVVLLMLITALVGMDLAASQTTPIHQMVLALIGIALMASSAAAINHLVDERFDRMMQRTQHRPLPTGALSPENVLCFALLLGCVGFYILYAYINTLCAWLTFATLLGYAVFYTVLLKHWTPQNIVIGGLSGAMPPLLGWVAVNPTLTAMPYLLVLIIFIWTPPHFWALAVHRAEEYAKTNIPMLPVTHGIPFTTLNILLYTLLLTLITLLPFVLGLAGVLYLIPTLLLNLKFLIKAWRLYRSNDKTLAFQTFRYSITYLGLLFVALLLDHHLGGLHV